VARPGGCAQPAWCGFSVRVGSWRTSVAQEEVKVGDFAARIVLGPSVLGWVVVDTPIQILALIGVTFILFLAGLEIDFDCIFVAQLSAVQEAHR